MSDMSHIKVTNKATTNIKTNGAINILIDNNHFTNIQIKIIAKTIPITTPKTQVVVFAFLINTFKNSFINAAPPICLIKQIKPIIKI